MTPGARIQAVIELLDEIETHRPAATDIIAAYFRKRRYAGSKDRRFIRTSVFAVVRHRAKLDWWIERTSSLSPSPRLRVLVSGIFDTSLSPDNLDTCFTDAPHDPAPLDNDERAMVAALGGQSLEHPDQPIAVRFELPTWIAERMEAYYGPRFNDEAAALNVEAPVDLRVALARVTREQAQKALQKEDVATVPTPLSPAGLRLEGHTDINHTRTFVKGLVEVQDEGSQLLAFLCDVAPGMDVLDFCAGGGGKTLALADRMGLQGAEKNARGRLVATDIDARRLSRMGARLKRGRLDTHVESQTLAPTTQDDPWLQSQHGTFDRVLVDAPCSGSGAWRRQPEARWRLTPARLDELTALQDDVLNRAADCVKPEGWLIYATCSLLAEENEARAQAFLQARSDFNALTVRDVWDAQLPATPCPRSTGTDAPATAPAPWLRLSPAASGTDGFFIAIFQRTA